MTDADRKTLAAVIHDAACGCLHPEDIDVCEMPAWNPTGYITRDGLLIETTPRVWGHHRAADAILARYDVKVKP